MRITVVFLCLVAAACGGGGLNSPTSPTDVTGAARPGGDASHTQALHAIGLPLRGSFAQNTRSTFVPPITLLISGTASGTATQLGRFTASTEEHVDTTSNTSVGTFNFTAADGDQLFTETAGAEDGSGGPNISKVTLHARIVGGTGRFAGTTGTLTIRLTQTIDFETNSATGTGTFEGRLVPRSRER